MTFPFYVYISVVGNAIGAFGSLLAGLGDRWGRANLTAYGLVVTALLALFGIPNAGDKWTFAILSVIIGLVEGVILVATPALVRDFSPQLGRASAMGFWTLGPVIGSLVVAVVSTNTVNHLGPWQDQYIICGVVGLIVGVIALFGLRELSPRLRDQLMVSLHDRALIEAKARGIDPEAAMGKSHWRQMMHLDIVGSAFAISVFLLIYYAAVGFFTIYFTTLFGFSLSKANSIGNWFWAFDAGVLIITGIISDRFRVRKPFMVVGGIGAIVMTIVFAQPGHQDLVLDDRDGDQRPRGVPRHRVRAVDGQLHRDGREAQPGADRDGAGRVGMDHPRRGRALRALPADSRRLDDAGDHLRRPGSGLCDAVRRRRWPSPRPTRI